MYFSCYTCVSDLVSKLDKNFDMLYFVNADIGYNITCVQIVECNPCVGNENFDNLLWTYGVST